MILFDMFQNVKYDKNSVDRQELVTILLILTNLFVNTLLPIIEFHKRDIDVNNEIELNVLLELLFWNFWKALREGLFLAQFCH